MVSIVLLMIVSFVLLGGFSVYARIKRSTPSGQVPPERPPMFSGVIAGKRLNGGEVIYYLRLKIPSNGRTGEEERHDIFQFIPISLSPEGLVIDSAGAVKRQEEALTSGKTVDVYTSDLPISILGSDFRYSVTSMFSKVGLPMHVKSTLPDTSGRVAFRADRIVIR